MHDFHKLSRKKLDQDSVDVGTPQVNGHRGDTASLAKQNPIGLGFSLVRPSRTIRTATPSVVREVNQSIILDLIQLHESISRAELSRKSGIHRSNVSHIVDRLIDRGLVIEKPATLESRGRIPMLLSLNPKSFWIVGTSIRPFQTSVAFAGLTGEPFRTLSFTTPRKPEELIRKLSEKIEKINQEYAGSSFSRFEEIGVSAPGLVHSNSGKIIWLPSLPEYSGFQFAAELEKRIGVPTAIDNDTNLAALAELRRSETADLRDFVVLAVDDVGVGTGIVLNRELYRGHNTSFAGEFGHMIIDSDGPQCSCGRHGCWELYVTSRAAWHRYSPQTEFDHSQFQNLIRSAQQGEPKALNALRETARYLSMGISNIFFVLNPEVVIITGQITKAWDLLRSAVEQAFLSANLSLPIRVAGLDAEQLYLQGSIHLALNKAFRKPVLGL